MKNLFFEKINKIDGLLVRLEKERTQIANSKNESEDITANVLKRIIKEYFEQLYAPKLDNLD